MASITPVGVRLVVQNFGQFQLQLNAVGSSLARLGGYGSKVSSAFSLMNAGIRAGVMVAGAATAALAGLGFATGKLAADSVKTAASFESSFAGMLKTVYDLTDPATNQINKLGETVKQQFRDLAKEIPVTFEELARIGTVAGQLDIPAEALPGFTKNIAAITVSTDLTADEATTNFATIAKIFQVQEEDIVNWSSQFGSALVQLGNNFAANEPDILSFSERIAGVGAALGLTAQDTIAIGAAFSQSGIQMQRGGTAVQKVLIKMNESIQEGGKDLETIAKVAMGDMNNATEEFIKLDPAEQFRLFTEGLGQQGPEAVQVLKELEIADQRLIGAFLNIGSAQGELTRAFDESNSAFEANTALARESEIFYGTFENQVELANNKVRDLKASLGEEVKENLLAPLLENANDWLDRVAPQLEESFKEMGDNIKEYLLPSINNLIGVLFGGAIDTRTSEQVEKDIRDAIAGGMSFQDAQEQFGFKGIPAAEEAPGMIISLSESIDKLAQSITDFRTAKGEGGESVLALILGTDKETAGNIVTLGKTAGYIWLIAGGLSLLSKAILGVLAAFSTGGAIVEAGGLGAWLLALLGGPVGILVAFIAAFGSIAYIFQDEIGKFMYEGIFVPIKNVIDEYVLPFIGGVAGILIIAFLGFAASMQTVWVAVKEWWDKIKTTVAESWEETKATLTEAWETIKTEFSETWQAVKDSFDLAWQQIKEGVQTAKQTLIDKFNEIKTGITNIIEGLVGSFWSWGWNMINNLIKGVQSAMNSLGFPDVAGWIGSLGGIGGGGGGFGGGGGGTAGGGASSFGGRAVSGSVSAPARGLRAGSSSLTNVNIQANYMESQSPAQIADDLAMIGLLG